MEKIKNEPYKVIFRSSDTKIENIFSLPKIGAGHDGYVYKYNDLALKLLKYNTSIRKEKGLMTFDKADFFINNLLLKRIVCPIDTLLNGDGMYCGYAMPFLNDVTLREKKETPEYKDTSSFTCGNLLESIDDLQGDVEVLNKNRVLMKDINTGSYIFSSDFMHLCDMDKFRIYLEQNISVVDRNREKLNFIIAKFLYSEMKRARGVVSKEEIKLLLKWVKRSASAYNFLDTLEREIVCEKDKTIGQFTKEKADIILK